jgi:hypothetical protein
MPACRSNERTKTGFLLVIPAQAWIHAVAGIKVDFV